MKNITPLENNYFICYTIYGGNPAKYIKKRFDEELISLLLKLKWWDFEPNKLVIFLPNLCNSNLVEVKEMILKQIHS